MWPAIPIFELGWAIPVKSHVWKFGSDWLSLSGVIVSTNIFLRWAETPIRGVTFDLWCPFSNLGVLFQSKVMCWKLVWIGWNQRYVKFDGGGRPPICRVYMWPVMPIFELRRAIPVKSHVWKLGLDCLKSEVCIFKGGRNPLLVGLHVTCDPHLRTWPSYSSQKSCVKIWFGLLKPFKSYRVHKHFSRGAEDPLFGGFTCDLWCPFSNSDVLFQSKVMCENLVWIGWNRRCAFSRVGAETPY